MSFFLYGGHAASCWSEPLHLIATSHSWVVVIFSRGGHSATYGCLKGLFSLYCSLHTSLDVQAQHVNRVLAGARLSFNKCCI